MFLNLIVLLCFGCNEKPKLSHPKIFNELYLGMDYDSTYKIIDKVCLSNLGLFNSICYQIENDCYPFSMVPIEPGIACQLKITNEIYAEPNLFYAKFKGKKILGSATLLFHSPTSFPKIEVKEYNGRQHYYIGVPAVTFMEANKIIEFYDAKYGKRKKNKYQSNYTWEADDMIISMYKESYDDLFFVEKVLTHFAYRVVVTYRYNEEKLKLLELDKKTKSGESVGNKV
jgi:hypothetical protein